MKFEELTKGTLIKRYKRFLADVKINNEIITVHCPNSGSMIGLAEPENTVYLSKSKNPKNKLPFKLELIEHNNILVSVNTSMTNHLVKEALENKVIKELADFDIIETEKKFLNSRFDFLLTNSRTKDKTVVEVKSVTLSRHENIGEFPDAKTQRGSKHLKDLNNLALEGIKTTNLYIAQRDDINIFEIAKDIDPEYYQNFLNAKNNVDFICYGCNISLKEIKIDKKIPINFT